MFNRDIFKLTCNDFNKISSDVHRIYFDTDKIDFFHTQQEAIDFIERSGIKGLKMFNHEYVPFDVIENGETVEKKGTRKFFVCSWQKYFNYVRDIPNQNNRSCYEMICYEPCHIYLDADYDLTDFTKENNPTKSVATAIVEFMECFRIFCETRQIEDPDDEFWQFSFDDVRLMTGISDTEIKQSRHVIIVLPNGRMFHNFNHVKRVVNDVVQLSIERHLNDVTVDAAGGKLCNSPLMFNTMVLNRKTHQREATVASFFDKSVYTKYRNMRSLYNQKSCHVGETKGVLLPKCVHFIECSYEKPHCDIEFEEIPPEELMTELEVFIGNCATFIPLDKETCKPMELLIGKYKSAVGDEKDEISKAGIKQFMQPNPNNNSGIGDSITPFIYKPVTCGLQAVFDAYQSYLARQMGTRIEMVPGSGSITGCALFSTRSKDCPYKGSSHENTHMQMSVVIGYPLPRVYYKCLVDQCKSKLGLDPKTNKVGLIKIQQNEQLELYESIWAPITKIIEKFMLERQFNATEIWPVWKNDK